MSPERTRRAPTEIDARSDLYGLGATVYALLTGRPPFEGTTLVEKITRIRQTAPDKPTKYQMSIPAMFEGVVLKLLAKDPKDRYQTAAGVGQGAGAGWEVQWRDGIIPIDAVRSAFRSPSAARVGFYRCVCPSPEASEERFR